MKRKAGYYWVKYPNRDKWSIEYWNGGMWFTRSPTLLNDNDFTEIDEKPIVREQNNPTSQKQLATPDVSQRSELLAFKRFISNTPLVELEYYSDEEFTDAYIKANSC